MPVPLTIVAPAAAAATAYINARTYLGSDLRLLGTMVKSTLQAKKYDRQDRVNLFYRMEEQAQDPKVANLDFLWYEGRNWTYKESYEATLRYASWIKATYGVQPKDVIALDYMNSPQYLFVMFAVWSLGATPALINYNLTGNALLHCVRTSTAKILLVDQEVKAKFTPDVVDALASKSFYEDGSGPVSVRFHDEHFEAEVAKTTVKREPDSCRTGAGINVGNRTCALIYTSGTTGLPKAAIVSWGKPYGTGNFMRSAVGLKPGEVYYTCMPLYHSTALILGVMPCFLVGATAAIGRRFSNKTFWPEVRESRSTIIQYVGETCRYLLAAPAHLDPVTGENLDKKHQVRVAFGNGMRPDVWQRFKDRFNIETICEFYGATEAPAASFNVSSNNFSRGAIGKRGSLIKLLTGSVAAVVEVDWETETPKRDPSNHNMCTRVPPNTPGELIYQVDPADIVSKFQGYYGNNKASNSKIMQDVFKKGDAWYRTGDCVRVDKDGFTWFNDRIGDTFRWRSENVSTNEVSEVLGLHPAITEANVYGVEVPHHDGRCGCAAVTLNAPVEPQLLKSIAQQATSNLPRYAVPIFIRVVEQMTSTGNNKQQKHGLRVQGVDPAKVDAGDRVLWMKDGTYVDFGPEDFKELQAGNVKL